MFEKYCEGTPIFVVIDVRMGVEGLPTVAYQPSNEITVDGSSAGVVQRVFKHIPVSIQADEGEAVSPFQLSIFTNSFVSNTFSLLFLSSL